MVIEPGTLACRASKHHRQLQVLFVNEITPPGLYGTRPAGGGNKAKKLSAIREALRTAKRVWLATDCDREGQLIGQEILEHYDYRGEVMRVLFTAQDHQTIRDAFSRAKPNSEYAHLYAAAVARRQADQIYNLSLTRTATVILGRGARGVIGVGRVKTPTLAIVCTRELEIRDFVPVAYYEVVVTANVAGGCGARRMAEGAALLVDEVLPREPMRQWLLSVPFALRYLFATDPAVMGQVLGIVTRAIASYLIKAAGYHQATAQTGAVTLIERFGSALNMNIHFHMLFLDGVYVTSGERLSFRRVPPPTVAALEKLVRVISERVGRALKRQGLLVRDFENSFLTLDPADVSGSNDLLGHSITYRIALGPHQGRKACMDSSSFASTSIKGKRVDCQRVSGL